MRRANSVALVLGLALVLSVGSVPPAGARQASPAPAQGSPPAGKAGPVAPAPKPKPQSGAGAGPGESEGERPAAAPRRFRDPYSAYDAGAFDQALEGFVDRQVERPEDPRVQLDVGSARYKLRDWPEAERSFAAAAAKGDPKVRARALYNLGNTAYRQGKLEEAVSRYQSALDLDPDDQDAKFNLEFVRDEIRRRLEEAKKRQEQQQQQQNQQGDQGQNQEQNQDQNQQGDQGQDPQQQQQQQGGDQDQGGPDSDRDGLPDQVERSGANPTDPGNPDTDGDGRLDGEEDANHNGQVDPGESDPNHPDAPQGNPQQAAGGEPQQGDEMTPEEAERYLQSLGEGLPRPQLPPDARAARRARQDKDW